MISPEDAYRSRLKAFEQEERRHYKTSKLLSWFRLATFLGILVSVYFTLTAPSPLTGLAVILFLIILLVFLIFYSTISNKKLNYYRRLASLCKNELKALKHDFLDFYEGSEFMDPDHVYSSDLDIFGKGSAFQYLNRTVTHPGRKQLVTWLTEPIVDAGNIKERQEACRELSGMVDWRLQFNGKGLEGTTSDSAHNFLRWLKIPNLFRNHALWIKALQAWQIAMLILMACVIAAGLNFNFLLVPGLLNLAISWLLLKRINQVASLFGNTHGILSSYSELMECIGKPTFSSGWLESRRLRLVTGGENASREIGALGRLIQRFDARSNLLVGFTRNALFLTDLFLVIKMEMWKNRNAGKIAQWLEALGEIDAMNSLAAYSFNNPTYAYPIPEGGSFSISSRKLGHPLIPPDIRVSNDFTLANWHTIIVLTGANMAGKSTFLRTAGLNHVLAHTGAPVCAEKYKFYPTRLITSIRTNDSLIKHESYFYAELKKLKRIIDALEKGEEVFILLDEVLKGTNSNDKLNGSIILLRKLLKLKTSGIIATHDIALGELEQEFPSNIQNRCFEAEIRDGELLFDYKLRQGSAQNMTALFLMKQMSIV